MQLIRTPEFRAYVEQMNKHSSKVFAKESGTKRHDIAFLLSPDNPKRLHLSFILNPKVVTEFVEFLYYKNSIVFENKTSTPLWTSDHPVTLFNHYNYPGNLGIMSQGVEIHFPVTSRLSLSSFDPRFSTIKEINMKADNVIFHNELQTQTATRFIYSPSPDFRIAERYLEINPTYRNPQRRRVVVKSHPEKVEFLRTMYGHRIKANENERN